jgi:hypothetical protein
VAAAALWARSYVIHDEVNRVRAGRWLQADSGEGRLRLLDRGRTGSPATHFGWQRTPRDFDRGVFLRGLSAFDVSLVVPRRGPVPALVPTLALPHWAAVLTLGLLPAGRFVSHRRRRTARGSCARCGCDLTGNTGGICPECGTPRTQGRS